MWVLASFIGCGGFVTADFSRMGLLAPCLSPHLEDWGLHFVLPLPFHSSGIGCCTRRLCFRQHSSWGHWGVQTSSSWLVLEKESKAHYNTETSFSQKSLFTNTANMLQKSHSAGKSQLQEQCPRQTNTLPLHLDTTTHCNTLQSSEQACLLSSTAELTTTIIQFAFIYMQT